jgi:hypothetical protein
MNDLPKVPPLQKPEKSIEPRPVRPWDLFNKNKDRVSKEIKDERMAACLACPLLIQATKQCKKCGCFMHAKTLLADAACPIGKWGQVDVPFTK